jgi:type IV pilus assembly protein PilF
MSRLQRPAPLLAALLAATLAGCITSGGGREVDNTAAADSNVKLGVAYMNEGRMELAKETLERAGGQDPKNADVQFALAELYSRLEQPKVADRHYRADIDLAPDKLEIVNGYAVFLCTNQEVDRGIAQFEKLMHNPLYGRQAAAATNAGMCLRDQKRHGESVRFFETALAKQPDWLEAVVQLADVQILLENPVAARAAVDKYQSMRNSATALVMGVRAAVKEGNCNAARTYTLKLRKDFPNSRETLQLLPQVTGACAENARQ